MTSSRTWTEPYLFLCHQILAYVVEALFLIRQVAAKKYICHSQIGCRFVTSGKIVCYYFELGNLLNKSLKLFRL